MIPSLAHALQSALAKDADKEALVLLGSSGEQRATRAEIDAHARDTAHRLIQNGIQPGEILLILLDHTYEAIPMFLGALYMGAVPMIMPYLTAQTTPAQQAEQIAGLIAFFKSTGLLTVPRFYGEIDALNLPVKTLAWDFDTVDAASVPPLTLSTRSGEDLAYLQFTSGTTGQPKAVMVSHRALREAFDVGAERFKLTSADVTVIAAPLSHASGLVGATLHMLWLGIRSVIISPSYWAQTPSTLLRAIHDYCGTYSILTNTGLNLTMLRVTPEEMAGIDLSRLRVLVVGSEMISPATLYAFAQRFSPFGFNAKAFTAAYGASEAYIAFQGADNPLRVDTVDTKALMNDRIATPVAADAVDARAVASCGTPLRGVTIEIHSDTGKPLPDRHLGQIVAHAKTAFSGYLNNAELTAAVLKNGWYHTGDLGYLVDGELYVVGRVKDLIIVGGRNLLPEAVEEEVMVAAHGLLRGAVAFGVRDEMLGTEQPVVIGEMITPLDDEARNQATKAIRTRIRQRLNMALADVFFVDAGWIVRAGVKLARNANHDKYLATKSATAPAPAIAADESLPDQVTVIFEEILGYKPVGRHDNFFDLGGDSISALKMLLLVEKRLGHAVPSAFFQQPTVDTLVRLLAGESIVPSAVAPEASMPTETSVQSSAQNPNEDKRTWTAERIRKGLRRRLETRAFQQGYFEGIRWLAGWSGNHTGQQLFYPQEVALFRQFWASLHGTKPLDPQELQRNLMGNIILQRLFKYINRENDGNDPFTHALQASSMCWMRELGTAMDAREGELGRRIFDLQGQETLEHSVQPGQGIIVISYHATTRFFRHGCDSRLEEESILARNEYLSSNSAHPIRQRIATATRQTVAILTRPCHADSTRGAERWGAGWHER